MNTKLSASAALGVAVGALLTWLVLIGTMTRRAERSPGSADAALLQELRSLRSAQARTTEVLVEIADALSRPALAPVESRRGRDTETGAGRLSFDALAESLDALRASIESESRRTQEVIRSAPAFGGESLGAVRRRMTVTNWSQLATLEKDWRADPKAADRSQYFQTPRDLLELYGPPDAIYRPNGGLLYMYRRHQPGEAGAAWYFRLQNGYVIEFYIKDEEPK